VTDADGHTTTHRHAGVGLNLAFGRDPGLATPIDWHLVLSIAVLERFAPIAWSRGAPFIRQYAPPDVVAAWRAVAAGTWAQGHRQLRTTAKVLTILQSEGVRPVVLKGLPMAMRLYGDPFVRASSDIDLYVSGVARDTTERALIAAGWKLRDGDAPWTQTFSFLEDSHLTFLEVHSSLVGHNLAHLTLPVPSACDMEIMGVVVPAHDDPFLPAYLAAHAAKHMPAPLIYLVDFLTLWQALDPSERRRAQDTANEVGLGRYLTWMVQQVRFLMTALDGDSDGLRSLGFGSASRSDVHAVFRDVALAATPFAAIRSVAAWVWPPQLRSGVVPMARRWAHRLRSPWHGYVRKRANYEIRRPM
jgi:hypothetical protein